MSKYKTFWIEEGSFIYACHERKEHLNGWRVNDEGPWQVIETQAVDDLQAKLDEACELLKSIYKTGKYVPVKHQKKIDEFLKGLGEG